MPSDSAKAKNARASAKAANATSSAGHSSARGRANKSTAKATANQENAKSSAKCANAHACIHQTSVTPSSGSLTVLNQGVLVESGVTTLNFVGTGIEAVAISGTTVNIYVPPLSLASHFNTADGTTNATVGNWATTSRYVSAPASEGNPFKIGSWTAGTLHPSITSLTLAYATAGLFSILNTNTNFTVSVVDANDSTVLATNSVVIGGNLNVTAQNITIQVSGFAPDSNKFKAQINVSIAIGSILLNGGRFSVHMTHADSTDGTFSFQQNDFFRDRNSVAATIGGVAISPNVPVVKFLSGVQWFNVGSTFNVGVSAISELNDETYPLTQVVVAGPAYGLPQLNLQGSNLTGWMDVYNNANASYSNANWAINQLNYWLLSQTATISATPEDWAAGATVTSNASVAIDTFVADQTALFEDFRNEALRLQTNLMSSWDSTQNLATYDGGNALQCMDSRLVYPQIDFAPYSPNSGSQPDYSSLSGNKVYRRTFNASVGNNFSNGTFVFGDHNVTEANLTANDVYIEVSLDGANWYVCNDAYLGGALSNGQGCRINSDTVNLPTNGLQFTLGYGFTNAATGNGWGVWVRLTYAGDAAGKAAYIGSLRVGDWT